MSNKKVNATNGQITYRNRKGRLHRDDGPAIIMLDQHEIWYRNGKRHRDNGPAVVHSNGNKAWYINDQLHRLDGPAVDKPSGEDRIQAWYKEGKKHREFGPAIIRPGGEEQWWFEGFLHNENGPALSYPDGYKEWHIHGKRMTEEEFNQYKLDQLNKAKEIIIKESLAKSSAEIVVGDKKYKIVEVEDNA